MVTERMRPRLFLGKARRFPAYRTLGVVGGVVGICVVGALALRGERPLTEVAAVIVTAPLAFVFAVKLSVLAFGYERIVFYEKTLFVLGTTALVLHLLGQPIGRGLDLSAIGIGVFLVFGRLGCFMVGCCYGCPSRRGVRYGLDHARAGFPRWLVGRALLPVQLIDAAVSSVAVIAAVIAWHADAPAGDAAAIYLVTYGLGRFVEERFRFDAARPRWLGVSEAQWTAVLISVALVLLVGPRWWTVTNAALLGVGILFVILAPRRFTDAWHVAELAGALRALETHKIQRVTTSLGVHVTLAHIDGTGGAMHDYLFSAPTASRPLAEADIVRFASVLSLENATVKRAITPGLFHVLVSASSQRAG